MGRVVNNHFIVVDPFNSGSIYPDILEEFEKPYVAVYSSRCRSFIDENEVLRSNKGVPTYFEWSYPDLAQMVHQLGELGNPRYIATGHDAGIELADKLRARLIPDKANVMEFPGARWSKAASSRALAAAGVDHLHSFTIRRGQSLNDVFTPELFSGRSFVLKPVASGGGDHVYHVQTPAEARERAAAMFNQQDLYGEDLDEIVAQEYFDGVEYVVDTVSRGGVHRVSDILVYGKHKSRKQEFIYDYARWVAPHEEVVGVLRRYAYQVLDAIGLKYGVAHIEILEREGRVVLVEVGTRPCGAGIPSLVYETSRHSQVHQELLWELKGTVPPDVYPFKNFAALVFLSSLDGGTFVNGDFQNWLETHPLVSSSSRLRVKVGDEIPPTRFLGDSTALGRVFIIGGDRDQVQSTVKETLAIFQASITPRKSNNDELA